MIRTGYLRWEIEVKDARSSVEAGAREVTFLARPSYRKVRVLNGARRNAAERFARGEASYQAIVRARRRGDSEIELVISDVGPRVFRYAETDRLRTPRFWMSKLQREAGAFAHEVVHAAARFPQLLIENAAIRAGYARLVETEIFRVIEGSSKPEPTRDDEPMALDLAAFQAGVPELVAAELVRDVVDKKEFAEFCTFDRVTVFNDGKYYRIPRRPHALVEVWDAQSLRGLARLCVVFQDPGMPPSDELVMKYLLAKHQPDLLWKLGVQFSAPNGKFDGAAPRRWSL
jgi:hypothetical protein